MSPLHADQLILPARARGIPDSVLSLGILWHTAKHGQSERSLDLGVSIDTGCHTIDNLWVGEGDAWQHAYPIHNILLRSKLPDLGDIVFIQSHSLEQVLLLEDVVCLNHSRKHGEPTLAVEGNVQVVAVDPGHLL